VTVATAGETLCRACGFCCDGTLFGWVDLDAAERRPLRSLPLVGAADGSVRLLQPCAAHAPAGCTVYGERPRTCASYRCDLLRSLEERSIDLDAALAHVSEAKRLSGQLIAALGLATPARIWTALGDATGSKRGELLMDAVHLATLLRRRFDASFRQAEADRPIKA
jgi:hypothetical protein